MKKIFFILVVFVAFSFKLRSQSMNCSTATNLSLNNGTACVNGTSAGALSDNILYGACNTVPINVVWYTYVTNGSNNNFTITPGSLTNAQIVIYQGGCPNTGTLQNCVTATGSNPIITSWGMTAGVQVWIGIASNNGISGTFNFCVNSQPPAPAPGNTCAQAKQICVTPYNQATIPSNSSGQAPACFGSAPQQDIWVKFTITQPGSLRWTATPNNPATEFDWALWDITNGCPGTLSCCNYNYAAGSSAGFGMQAQAGTVTCGFNLAGTPANEFCGPMNVLCGRTYAIQISNYSNNNTGFVMSFANSTALITSSSAFSVAAPTLVCGPSLNAVINNASTGTCNQVWNFGDGTPTYTGGAPPSHNYTTPGTYAITANIGGACPSSATQFVQLLAPLAATVNGTPPLCFGGCNGSATVNPITGGDGIYTYLWSTGSTSTSINGLCAGVYSITVSNAKCASNVTQTVNIVAPTQVTINANPTSASCGATNGSVTVNGAGGTPPYMFNINGGAYGAGTSFTGLGAGTYTMGIRDNNNCTGSVTVAIAAPPGPTVVVNSATACAGSPVTLIAGGATNYTWSPATGLSSTTGSTVSATPAVTTTYTITGAIGACLGTNTSVVTIDPVPTPTAANTGPYCPGNTIQLNVNAFPTYTWTGPSFNDNTQSPTIAAATVTNSGIYTVSIASPNGCIGTSTTNVIVNPIPSPTVGSNSPVCVGSNINLTAGGGTGYSWSGPNGFNSLAQNPSVVNSTTLDAGIYTVTVTANGCTNTGTVNVVVSTATTAANNTGPYCAGGSIQLNAQAATSYTWSGPLGYSSNAQNPLIASATTGMSGVYTLNISIGTCTASATTSVTVNALPNPNAGSNSPVCIGQPINFNGGGGTSYAWSGPGGFTDATQNPVIAVSSTTNSGSYTLTVTDANTCVNSTVIAVVVNAQPVVNAAGASVCENTNAQLTSGGGTSYSWVGPGGFTSGAQNPFVNNVTQTNAGQYTVTVTDANTCTNTAVATLTVNAAPVPTIVSNSPVCLKSIMSLNASGGLSYSWAGPNGFSSNAQNPTIVANSTVVSGVYVVTATGPGGCTGTATVNTIVNPLPVPNIINPKNKGCVPLCTTFSLDCTPTASTVTWNFDNGTTANNVMMPYTCYNSAGIFTITANVSDINGCNAATTFTVEVYPKPNADFVYGPVKPLENVDYVNLTDISWGTPIVAWNWYFSGATSTVSTQQHPNVLYKEAGKYPIALVVKSDRGCLDTVMRIIEVVEDFGIYVPNAFTPNGDGVNDFFGAKGYGITKFRMQIFNRWGESIFVSDDIRNQWPGNYQGKSDEMCQDDVYIWKIRVISINGKEKEMTGHVSLLK